MLEEVAGVTQARCSIMKRLEGLSLEMGKVLILPLLSIKLM